MKLNADTFHLFLSYARADNRSPVNQAGEGWVQAFKAELERRHAAYSGRELQVFFDRQDLGDSLSEGELSGDAELVDTAAIDSIVATHHLQRL